MAKVYCNNCKNLRLHVGSYLCAAVYREEKVDYLDSKAYVKPPYTVRSIGRCEEKNRGWNCPDFEKTKKWGLLRFIEKHSRQTGGNTIN
jgi:hypothetical protein